MRISVSLLRGELMSNTKIDAFVRHPKVMTYPAVGQVIHAATVPKGFMSGESTVYFPGATVERYDGVIKELICIILFLYWILSSFCLGFLIQVSLSNVQVQPGLSLDSVAVWLNSSVYSPVAIGRNFVTPSVVNINLSGQYTTLEQLFSVNVFTLFWNVYNPFPSPWSCFQTRWIHPFWQLSDVKELAKNLWSYLRLGCAEETMESHYLHPDRLRLFWPAVLNCISRLWRWGWVRWAPQWTG